MSCLEPMMNKNKDQEKQNRLLDWKRQNWEQNQKETREAIILSQ